MTTEEAIKLLAESLIVVANNTGNTDTAHKVERVLKFQGTPPVLENNPRRELRQHIDTAFDVVQAILQVQAHTMLMTIEDEAWLYAAASHLEDMQERYK